MMRQSLDTSYEAEKKQIELICKSSIAKRISLVRSLSETTLSLSRRAIKKSRPELNEREVDFVFVSYHYGENLANSLMAYLEEHRR